MTGRYARTTGVTGNGNEIPAREARIAEAMKAAGYYTIHVGKYINTSSGDCRPEYDYWAAHAGPLSRYVDPDLNINCTWFTPAIGYITYLFRDQAIEALRQVPNGQPFFLEFTPNAPHEPATPAPEDEHLYENLPPSRPPNFNPESWPLGGKPAWLTQAPRLSDEQIEVNVDRFRLDQLRSLASLDRSIGAILDELEAEEKLDNTLIIFWTDNGFFWGEQRLLQKNHVYEEASHFIFAIRYPPLIQVPFTDDRLVQVIDVGPTIYEITAVTPIGLPFDGRSLVPLLGKANGWRDALLLEGWPKDPNNPELKDHYQALRCSDCVSVPPESSGQLVYVETVPDPNGVGICDSPELYDIGNDPYEMNNLVNDVRYSSVVTALHERLASGDF